MIYYILDNEYEFMEAIWVYNDETNTVHIGWGISFSFLPKEKNVLDKHQLAWSGKVKGVYCEELNRWAFKGYNFNSGCHYKVLTQEELFLKLL